MNEQNFRTLSWFTRVNSAQLLSTSQDFRTLTSTTPQVCRRCVVRDGNGRITGPFQSPQNQFHCGQVIPLCAEANSFGEVNHDFTRLIKVLAREASASEEGISISPLVNTDRKGGAFPIMHSQFKRAIGVAIVGVMQHIRWQGQGYITMYAQLKNLLHTQQKQTAVSTDGTPTRQEDLVGMQSIHHLDMEYLSNSEMDMNTLCHEKAKVHRVPSLA
eukprot:scaffold95312_cov21-Cyclotella_meneghiniana.AAC.2